MKDRNPAQSIAQELSQAQDLAAQKKFIDNLEVAANTVGEGDPVPLFRASAELYQKIDAGNLTKEEIQEIAEKAAQALKPEDNK